MENTERPERVERNDRNDRNDKFDRGERKERKERTAYEFFNNGTYVREDEPIEVALKRFKREVTNAGILTELKKREFFEKPSIIKKRAIETAVRKRVRKRVLYNE